MKIPKAKGTPVIASKYLAVCQLNRPYDVLTRTVFMTGCDRFNILNKYSSYNYVPDENEIAPTWKEQNKSIVQLCVERAEELRGKRIAVFWSGGVDSTAIICSLILAGLDKQDITVVYNEKSIAEAPTIFEWIKREGIALDKFSSFDKYQNMVGVLGWCGGAVFGDNSGLNENPSITWREGISRVITSRAYSCTKYDIDNVIEALDEYICKLNLNIEYIDELMWLIKFGCKWSSFDYDYDLCMGDCEYEKCNFYTSAGFQDWALTHYKEFHQAKERDVTEYKKELKQIILDVTKDNDYVKNKSKVPSWRDKDFNYNIQSFYLPDGVKKYKKIKTKIPYIDLPERLQLTYDTRNIPEISRRLNSIEFLKKDVDVEEYLYSYIY